MVRYYICRPGVSAGPGGGFFSASPEAESRCGTHCRISCGVAGRQSSPHLPAGERSGSGPGSLKLENMTLVFKPTEDQKAALTALLTEQQDRSSSNYHQWLTPEQFAERFGLTTNDIDQVVAWVQSQGFTVTQTARSRLWISFSGTAAQVAAAFQTEIHNYSVNGKRTMPTPPNRPCPPPSRTWCWACAGLTTTALKPRGIFRQVKAQTHPNFTSSMTGNTYVAPGDFATIYDVNSLYSAGIDGTGQTIAVMGQTDLYGGGSDITAFRSAAGLPANSPQVILIPGATDPGVVSGDIEEASLDVEWSGAVAKNAKIIFVNGGAGGVFNALQYAIDQNLAPVISISYGDCEADWGTANLNALAQSGANKPIRKGRPSWLRPAIRAQRIAMSPAFTSIVTIATQGLAVDAPASSPYVTGHGRDGIQ